MGLGLLFGHLDGSVKEMDRRQRAQQGGDGYGPEAPRPRARPTVPPVEPDSPRTRARPTVSPVDQEATPEGPRIRARPEQSSLAKRVREESEREAGAREEREAGPREGQGRQPRHTEGVYVISVAARLLEMHPQTLRKYERLGLVQPARTIGMLRLYSEEDLYQLRLIRHLEDRLGLNLAGVEWALTLVSQLLEMHRRLSAMAEAERMGRAIRQEMEMLFSLMNLPMEDTPLDQDGKHE